MTELPQWQLALELRYEIDVARKPRVPTVSKQAARRKLKQLIQDNPRNVRSSHVRHNLGVQRIRWLEERPSLGWRS